MAPMRNGEGTSPSTWMAKTLSAMAVARSVAETKVDDGRIDRPVDKNRHSCAATIHVK